MRRVVADTSPLFYLLSIDLIDLLPQLFGRLSIPDAVHNELNHPRAPLPVRDWAAVPPSWLGVVPVDTLDDLELVPLGDGERAAITLAQFLKADLILIDERKGTAVALNKGFEVTGTLGVLGLAARHGYVDLADSFARLKRTNFRYRQEIMDALLNQHAR